MKIVWWFPSVDLARFDKCASDLWHKAFGSQHNRWMDGQWTLGGYPKGQRGTKAITSCSDWIYSRKWWTSLAGLKVSILCIFSIFALLFAKVFTPWFCSHIWKNQAKFSFAIYASKQVGWCNKTKCMVESGVRWWKQDFVFWWQRAYDFHRKCSPTAILGKSSW